MYHKNPVLHILNHAQELPWPGQIHLLAQYAWGSGLSFQQASGDADATSPVHTLCFKSQGHRRHEVGTPLFKVCLFHNLDYWLQNSDMFFLLLSKSLCGNVNIISFGGGGKVTSPINK